jgi:hypothetical protein
LSEKGYCFGFIISLAHHVRILLDVAALHDSCESIRQLVHYDLRQIVTGYTRDVAVAHAILSHKDIVAQARSVACSRGNTDVCLKTKSAFLAVIDPSTTSDNSPYTQSTRFSPQHRSPNTPANPYPRTNSGGSC